MSSALGKHEQAWKIRRHRPAAGPVGGNIMEGTVKSALALAISDLDRRLAELDEQALEFDETALAVPENQEGLLTETAASLRKWRRKLIRLIPKNDLRHYNLNGG